MFCGEQVGAWRGRVRGGLVRTALHPGAQRSLAVWPRLSVGSPGAAHRLSGAISTLGREPWADVAEWSVPTQLGPGRGTRAGIPGAGGAWCWPRRAHTQSPPSSEMAGGSEEGFVGDGEGGIVCSE